MKCVSCIVSLCREMISRCSPFTLNLDYFCTKQVNRGWAISVYCLIFCLKLLQSAASFTSQDFISSTQKLRARKVSIDNLLSPKLAFNQIKSFPHHSICSSLHLVVLIDWGASLKTLEIMEWGLNNKSKRCNRTIEALKLVLNWFPGVGAGPPIYQRPFFPLLNYKVVPFNPVFLNC